MLLQSADVCLADLCDMLHCDHFVHGHGSSFKSFQQRTAPCRLKLKGQLKHHCQVSICGGLYLLHIPKCNEHAAQLLSQSSQLTCSVKVVMHQKPICFDMQMTCIGSVYSGTYMASVTDHLTHTPQSCLQDVADVCFPIADGREAMLMHGEFSNAFCRPCSCSCFCFV